MNLVNYTLAEAQRFTSHYPLLLVGANSAGKTFALEQMPEEDKKRTDVFNFDLKPISTGVTGEFHTVHTTTSSHGALTEQIAIITAKGKELATQDKKHPALPRLKEQLNHLKHIKKTSYAIDDIESIDKLTTAILECTFNPDVDRVVADTVTAMSEFCEAWANTHYAGREVWNAYGVAHQKVMQALKEVNTFGCKYVYMFAHHDHIPPALYETTLKEAVKVKGGIMSGNLERHFTTVVFAYVNSDGDRIFECSNENLLDTSRTKLTDSKFSFKRISLNDLELLFAGKASIVDGVVVEG